MRKLNYNANEIQANNSVNTLKKKVTTSLGKFNLDLRDKIVLTEAATGNYVVTPVIAALSGAKVFAFTRGSKHGTVDVVKDQTYRLAEKSNIQDKIIIITNLEEAPLNKIDVLTNVGFLRPIDAFLIDSLSQNCVIPLMWEPWELRQEELDLEACQKRGIKVYGTNEDDDRLQTMSYLGYIVLYFLLDRKLSPFSSRLLLLGGNKFVSPVMSILSLNKYQYDWISDYKKDIDVSLYDAIIIAEHENRQLLIGEHQSAFINSGRIAPGVFVLHIAGNVNFETLKADCLPAKPASFGHMSYTTDYIDSMAVVDLHTAGLKVAEGMLKANALKLKKEEYKNFMERHYPALAFANPKYW